MERKKRIYIAGKVTGLPLHEVSMKFGTAQKKLMSEGYEVVNPLNHIESNMDWDKAMKICFELLANCDAIYMLHDWEVSKGAVLEHAKAKTMGIPIFFDNNTKGHNANLSLQNSMQQQKNNWGL